MQSYGEIKRSSKVCLEFMKYKLFRRKWENKILKQQKWKRGEIWLTTWFPGNCPLKADFSCEKKVIGLHKEKYLVKLKTEICSKKMFFLIFINPIIIVHSNIYIWSSIFKKKDHFYGTHVHIGSPFCPSVYLFKTFWRPSEHCECCQCCKDQYNDDPSWWS